ncbi:Histone-lysine N-methyltransferase, H3 lysine-9 specific SUVH6 [Dichanthelium oligosanthes]|uniref:Histone-lysine N-methyltransferase, H3 lysine-9 specific SUVH6 n=1 Tax=Dichanthelium oligosanthes TaxID=888268 RepID=A0A1E5VM30_9POAL|nr:Histone-lysine N-methyltransferase, H3 lysine-9 specific SUVH6 [Dichanthelium oligosanthes]
MVGIGVEPPPPPAEAAAAGLSRRRLRPGRVSAKRSWPPGCGRPPPAPPRAPAPAAAAGDGEKGADGGAGVLGGRAGEAIAPAAVSPLAQNGFLLQQQGSDKVEEAVVPAAISPVAQNGDMPRHQRAYKVEAAAIPAAVLLPAQNGSDNREEAVAPAAISPMAQNGALPRQQVADKAEEAAAPAAVSPVAQNGYLPQQQGTDKVEAAVAPAAVSPVAQNGDLPQQQGSDKMEAAASLAAVQNGAPRQQGQNKVEPVAPSAVSPATCNGSLSHALPQSGPESALEDGDKGKNEEAQLLADAGTPSLDCQEGNSVVAPAVTVLESCGIVAAASSVQNGGEGTGLVGVEEQGGGGRGEVGREEVAADRDAMEMGNRTGGGEPERKENGVAGSRAKRWLTSAVNPPPKKRAVSAVRKFPPGCGRTAVTTEGNGVLEVSPVRTFPPDCETAAVTATDSGVLDVSPIRTLPPGCGRSAVTTTDNGHEEGLPLEATPVTNGDAFVAIPVLEGAASPILALEVSNENLKGKRNGGHNRAHNRVQTLDDFVGTEQNGDLQRNFVSNATLRNGFKEKMEGKLSPCEEKHVARAMVDDKMKNKLEESMHRSTLRIPLSDPVDAKTKGKSLEGDMINAALLGSAKASIGGKMQYKTLSTKKEVVCSNVNMKQNKFARKLKGDDGIGKDNLHRSAKESKFGKHVATNQIQESDDMNLVPSQLIVQALMAPDKCPWARGRKSKVSVSKSLAPRNKLKGKDATPKKLLTGKIASCESINDETMEGNDDYMEDNGNSRALVVYGEKQEICVMVPPSVPFGSHHRQLGYHDVDARSKVRKLLQLFQATCRKLMQVEEQGIRNVGRIDLEAIKALKKDPIYKKLGAMVGNIPGVEVGDEFHFRVELSIVGLHRPNQAGIDTAKVNGVPVAISIVASGCYADELSSSDELIYTGSGGKAGGNKEADDQKLERGQVLDKNGEEKVKHCYCGASDCCGRLY